MQTAREVKIEATGKNKYFNVIKTAYQPIDGKSKRPNPTPLDILYQLFKLYLKESQRKFLYVFPGANHSHINEIETACTLLEQNKTLPALLDVFTLLNKITRINPEGDLAILLGTYFSVFPQYLDKITSATMQAAINPKLSHDLWEQPIHAWFENFKQSHRKGDENDHEQLEAISLLLPKEKADEFADFLLAQLASRRPEARPGIYKGWCYIALGALSACLSAAKKKEVTAKLYHDLTTQPSGLSTIGLCEALTELTQDAKQLTVISDYLYRYTVKEIPSLIDLYGDHHRQIRDTVALYMPRVFSTLKKLEGQYEPITQSSIMTFLLENANIYPLRSGIHQLHHWLTESQTRTLLTRLNLHDKFLTLVPLFWEWLQREQKNPEWAAFRTLHRQCADIAKIEIITGLNEQTHILEAVRFLTTDRLMTEQDYGDIIQPLGKMLYRINNANEPSQKRIELHTALALTKNWCNHNGKNSIGVVICESLKKHAADNDEVVISAVSSASEFLPYLGAEVPIILECILPLLESSYSKSAAAALEVFAKHAHPSKLPELMTRLLSVDNSHTQLLLAKIYDHFHEQIKAPTHNIKLAK